MARGGYQRGDPRSDDGSRNRPCPALRASRARHRRSREATRDRRSRVVVRRTEGLSSALEMVAGRRAGDVSCRSGRRQDIPEFSLRVEATSSCAVSEGLRDWRKGWWSMLEVSWSSPCHGAIRRRECLSSGACRKISHDPSSCTKRLAPCCSSRRSAPGVRQRKRIRTCPGTS